MGDEVEPLLVHQECLACKHAPREDEGPPYRRLVLVAILMLCNALPISILFPYIYFMVRDFHIAKTDSDIGFYAGWIGASFMLGRCSTGIFWGILADRYGRKPVMLSGILAILVFNTLFGCATTFWMAIVTRLCLGSLNGIYGTIQAVASEVSSKKYQSLGMAVVSTMWGFGLIIGPAMGGFLAEPALKYPEYFPDGSLFARFPYLLPPLCVSVFALFALVACYMIPETLHKHGSHGETNFADETGLAGLKTGTPKKRKSILSNKALVSSVMIFSIASLHDIAYTEIFSLWAVRPKDRGGLAFTSSDIGRVLTIAGCGMLVSQLGIFPRVTRRVGPVLVSRVASGLTVPLMFIYLLMPKLDGAWLWTVVLLVSILKYILMEATVTGLAILVNNSVGQEERGTANGFSMSMFSLFKAIGPAAGGSVFAWSQKRFDASFLPGDQMVFAFLAFWMLLVSIGTFVPLLPQQ